MNALTKIENTALAAMTEQELVTVLQSSLYPGAKIESIKMVLGYCKAAGLDPMQKPVHIVPMWNSRAQEMQDVIMPGVGLYRTQASRTERFAGQSEPEFGPMIDQAIGGFQITYPEWARVTVKKLMTNGAVAEFTACEYWLENYAVKGGKEKSIAPNAMWAKRPRGQIAKCAAAQALRLAFPEMGAQPTAEEMEGKGLDEQPERNMGAADVLPPAPAALPEFTAEHLQQRATKITEFYSKGKTADEVIAFYSLKSHLSEAMKNAIRGMAPKAATSADVEDATPKVTYAQLADRLQKCADGETAALILDEARGLPQDQQEGLSKIHAEKFN